jgi:hypothetical protein
VLLRAKADRQPDRVAPFVDRLVDLGFHLDLRTLEAVLYVAGER